MQTRYFILFTLIFAIGAIRADAEAVMPAERWASVNTPTHTDSQSIGAYTHGCISGAVPLPLNGQGYQVMRVSRQRYFGHPNLVGFIETLGQTVTAAKLGTLLIGDLGQPRGGPMLNGHRSHQSGLDVDIWFLLSRQADERVLTANERETWSASSVIDAEAYAVDYRQWSLAHAKILEITARQPEVERIFVHPGIKRALCQSKSPGSAEWLGKIRPWWKHDDHFHVRLRCPSDNPYCESQEKLPAGDGCDAGLDWWFSEEAKQPAKSKPEPPPPLPAQCESVLSEK